MRGVQDLLAELEQPEQLQRQEDLALAGLPGDDQTGLAMPTSRRRIPAAPRARCRTASRRAAHRKPRRGPRNPGRWSRHRRGHGRTSARSSSPCGSSCAPAAPTGCDLIELRRAGRRGRRSQRGDRHPVLAGHRGKITRRRRGSFTTPSRRSLRASRRARSASGGFLVLWPFRSSRLIPMAAESVRCRPRSARGRCGTSPRAVSAEDTGVAADGAVGSVAALPVASVVRRAQQFVVESVPPRLVGVEWSTMNDSGSG